MDKVLFTVGGRIARITPNRPEVLNAIDDDVPILLQRAVEAADADPAVHAILLSGAGRAYCAGDDLTCSAQAAGGNAATRPMPRDPMKDDRFMWRDTQAFMSLWRALKPSVCKVQGFAVAGGSDIALCCDMVRMAEDAQIGFMPTRVWGCPTTAMWVYRLGAERAKRLLFTGDRITGRQAADMGLVLQAVPAADLDDAVEDLAHRMASAPLNQLAMQKLVINQAIEAQGRINTQRLATVFDGITRHSPEGLAFKARAEDQGWKQAVQDRERGTCDRAANAPMPPGNR